MKPKIFFQQNHAFGYAQGEMNNRLIDVHVQEHSEVIQNPATRVTILRQWDLRAIYVWFITMCVVLGQ